MAVTVIVAVLLPRVIGMGSLQLRLPHLSSSFYMFGPPVLSLLAAIRFLFPFILPFISPFPTIWVLPCLFDLFHGEAILGDHVISEVVEHAEAKGSRILHISLFFFVRKLAEDFFMGIQFNFAVFLAIESIKHLTAELEQKTSQKSLLFILHVKTTTQRHRANGKAVLIG